MPYRPMLLSAAQPTRRHGLLPTPPACRPGAHAGQQHRQLGGTCRHGHLLTATTAYTVASGALCCKVCRSHAALRHYHAHRSPARCAIS